MNEKQGLAVVALKCNAENHIYEEQNEITPVICYEGEGVHTLKYTVIDYFGRVVAEGCEKVEGSGELPVAFAEKPRRGFYTVYTEIDGIPTDREDSFSVVMNGEERQRYDSFISMDTAGFFLIRSRIEEYARALYLAGVTHVRERDNENHSRPAEGEYDFSIMDRLMNAYSKYGIRAMPCDHVSAKWSLSGKKSMPDDIRTRYDYYKVMAARYGGKADFELWNEPDLFNMSDITEPADKMAALIKASAIGIRDAGTDALAVMPGFAAAPAGYAELMLENEVAKYVDTYSFHGHRGGGGAETVDMEVPSGWARHVANAEKYDLEHLYLYNTEAGIYTPMLNGKNFVEAERQRGQARYVPTSLIQGAAMGIDKQSYFVFAGYAEKVLQWGLFSDKHVPYAGYNALATLTHVLGEAKYVNCIPDLPKGVHGEVFANGGERVLALWCDHAETVRIKTNAASGLLTDIMGGERIVNAENGVFMLTVSSDIVYLTVRGDFEGATQAKYPARDYRRHTLTKAERVVLEQRYPEEVSSSAKQTGYRLPADGETEMTVLVTNFNDSVMRGTVAGKTFGGWSLSPVSQSVTVEPYAQVALTFKITGSERVTPETTVPVMFVGEFDGEKTSRALSNIVSVGEGEIEVREVIGASDAARWRKVSTDGSVLTIGNSDPDTMQVDCRFNGGDKWIYPTFALDSADSFEGTSGMIFDFYVEEDPKSIALRIFAYERNGSGYYTPNAARGLMQGWNRVKIPWSALSAVENGITDDNFTFDNYEVRRISIGINSSKNEIGYKLRNIGVYTMAERAIYPKIKVLSPVGVVDGETVIDAALIANETGICVETIKLRIDGREIGFAYADGRLTARVDLEAGEHKLEIKLFDTCGRVEQHISFFYVQ